MWLFAQFVRPTSSYSNTRVYDYFDKYTFLCEMFDEDADEIKELVLNFFPFDNSIQIIDTKKGKNLVKRVQLPPLKVEMLQIGNIVNIFSKLLYIKDCAPVTRKKLYHNVQSTFAIIKPVPPSAHGKIITFMMKNGFRIVRMKNGKIGKDFAMELYKSVAGSSVLPIIIDYVTSGEVIGLELVAPDAVQKWRECLGSTDPATAAPGTLRKLYGENKLKNVAHGCNTLEDATQMLDLFFGIENGLPRIPFRATFKNCSCCIIKPHVIIDGNVGAILEQIATSEKFYISAIAMFSVKLSNAQEFYEVYKEVLPEYEMLDLFFGIENGLPRIPFRATFKNCSCCIIKPHVIIDGNVGAILEQIATSEKFYISAIAMFSVKLSNAQEFYEVYKEVLPEYESMCIQLAEGKCIALEVKCTNPSLNSVCEFRKLCGPRDPELCRQLYPESIRALYGKNIIHNAVHCTDLPEDGELEVEYFFKLLAND